MKNPVLQGLSGAKPAAAGRGGRRGRRKLGKFAKIANARIGPVPGSRGSLEEGGGSGRRSEGAYERRPKHPPSFAPSGVRAMPQARQIGVECDRVGPNRFLSSCLGRGLSGYNPAETGPARLPGRLPRRSGGFLSRQGGDRSLNERRIPVPNFDPEPDHDTSRIVAGGSQSTDGGGRFAFFPEACRPP